MLHTKSFPACFIRPGAGLETFPLLGGALIGRAGGGGGGLHSIQKANKGIAPIFESHSQLILLLIVREPSHENIGICTSRFTIGFAQPQFALASSDFWSFWSRKQPPPYDLQLQIITKPCTDFGQPQSSEQQDTTYGPSNAALLFDSVNSLLSYAPPPNPRLPASLTAHPSTDTRSATPTDTQSPSRSLVSVTATGVLDRVKRWILRS